MHYTGLLLGCLFTGFILGLAIGLAYKERQISLAVVEIVL
jgi:hypothetical protein